MASFFDALKIITVPALIASFLYIVAAFVIAPLIRRHRERYSQYVPVDTILDTTSAVRSRITASVGDIILRLFERRRRAVQTADDDDNDSHDDDNIAFGDEEGEAMAGFDISRRERSVRGGGVVTHSDARLSRDLEEGFRDSSEEDLVDGRAVHARGRG